MSVKEEKIDIKKGMTVMLGSSSIENWLSGNGDNFPEYAERFSHFFNINAITDDAKKISYLSVLGGAELYSTLKRLLVPVDPTTKSYDECIEVLKSFYEPEVNEIAERYKFHKEEQQHGQSVSEYIVKLKTLSQSCKFGDFLPHALRDWLVFGLRDNQLRGQLLKEKKLTLAIACETAINWEMVENQKQKNNQIGVVMSNEGRGRGQRRNFESNSRGTNSTQGRKRSSSLRKYK